MSDFKTALARANQLVQKRLNEALAEYSEQPVERAMHYAISGGKGLRGFLVMESARLHGVAPENAVHAAAAIEAMHAYSLIHDDLPCMDDDDLRRGQPTVHIKWDEATAVLAGDGLQALAFDLLSYVEPANYGLNLVRTLAQSSGFRGMVGGQAMDMAAEKPIVPLNIVNIQEIHARKTGALFTWACNVGPLLSGTDPVPMLDYSTAFGLAFQAADDILDVTGHEDEVGKRVGKDAAAGKATYVTLLGLEGAKRVLDKYLRQAEEALEPYGEAGETLREAARFVATRRK